MLRRLAIGLAAAAAGALPEPPFVCDNTQCRVEPRNASAAPICAAGYYTCASCCDEDADCNCDGIRGDAYDHAWRTPKCPEGYYECRDCCDRDADCACDDQCERFRPGWEWGVAATGSRYYELPANVDCSLAYHENASKPHGWCPVGYHDCGQQHDCCDWSRKCRCNGAWRTGNLDERCGVGPTGRDGALRDFECSVHKGLGDPPLAGSYRGTEAGACCAGPNETAACADGYTVVEGDAPCVFTCCRNATNVTAVDVDAEGFCWEAHANEWRRLVERRDCCESECGDILYLDDDESAACMACQAEGVGYCVSRGECAYPVSGEKRVCDSPHDHIAASAAEAEWFCEQYGDELLHSDCGAALESDDAMGIGQCTGDDGDGNSPCRTVYFPEGPPGEWGERQRKEWFGETTCRPKADAPAACFARPTPRAD